MAQICFHDKQKSVTELWNYMTVKPSAANSANDIHRAASAEKKKNYLSSNDETVRRGVSSSGLGVFTNSRQTCPRSPRHAAQQRNWKWVFSWRGCECVGVQSCCCSWSRQGRALCHLTAYWERLNQICMKKQQKLEWSNFNQHALMKFTSQPEKLSHF